ncbi:MAG TPA: sulfite exporter TauE/SafE family protein [Rhodocyclaceae bacterium]|nr:sulfite exporter TauE/SafE family protein [Rhodocyclaceae bacterium]
MADLLSSLSITATPGLLAVAFAALVLAYLVFTLAGFGSGLIASAPLALVLPVARVVPLLALLDCGSSLRRGWRARDQVVWAELRQLVPGMATGQVLGVLMLSRIPPGVMAVLMGTFVAIQGCRGLMQKRSPSPSALRGGFRPDGAFLRGVFGGVLGGLFGSGGFVYATYLERRLEQREAFRATQSVCVALSTAWRLFLCGTLGFVDGALLAMALACLPAMILGTFIGHHVDLHLSRERLFLLLHGLLVASGVGLILRYV